MLDSSQAHKSSIAKREQFRKEQWSEEQWAEHEARKAAKKAKRAQNQVAKADANRSRKRVKK